MLGLRCDVVTKEEIMYIVFHDIDRDIITQQEIDWINEFCYNRGLSYLLYKTKHGYHLVCLTPIDASSWGECQLTLKEKFKSYYGGIIIRLSRKKDEKQELIALNETYGHVIPNLFNLYASRFGLTKKPWIKETAKYLLVFEKYRTEKE